MQENTNQVLTHVEHNGLMAKIEGEPRRWHASATFTLPSGTQYEIRTVSPDVFNLWHAWARDVDFFARKHPEIFAEWQKSTGLK